MATRDVAVRRGAARWTPAVGSPAGDDDRRHGRATSGRERSPVVDPPRVGRRFL
ncbi:hypothetical protein [Saliphagus infecundisoli]|uniref:Uncharacterized protein n=1 Tax=Saliphagus infecundisoli TaxID=1849069 RepID=A0ABD5QCN1_9EURY|nr:hypothetical protein [Saliphagus infecundisoli]